MNIFTGVESSELFGGQAPPPVQRLIDSARTGTPDEASAALWTAVLTFPRCLPPYLT